MNISGRGLPLFTWCNIGGLSTLGLKIRNSEEGTVLFLTLKILGCGSVVF